MTIDWYFFFRPVPLGTGRRITIRREIACGRHALATCSSSYWELHFAVLVPELHPRFSVHLRISIIIHHTPWLHTLPRGLLQKEIYPNTNWYGDHHPVICTGLFYHEWPCSKKNKIKKYQLLRCRVFSYYHKQKSSEALWILLAIINHPEGLDVKFIFDKRREKTRHLRPCYYQLRYGSFPIITNKNLQKPSGHLCESHSRSRKIFITRRAHFNNCTLVNYSPLHAGCFTRFVFLHQ